MAESFKVAAKGVSPSFKISAEEFKLYYYQGLSPIDIDIVKPPAFGPDGGYSHAMDYINRWFPWIDEKIVEPKYDGVCEFLGIPSNRPTPVKDFHVISLMRAVDYIVAPRYLAMIKARVGSVGGARAPASG